jgi:SAM-dependent methyltransferase
VSATTPNAAQAQAWNGTQGRHWAENAERQDRMFDGFARLVLDAAQPGGADRVLDIGCGAGGTTMEAARRAPGGSVLGADLSGLLLAAASRRAEEAGLGNVAFAEADAQVHPFPAGGFDVAVSRFGVMFFDDPDAAWANIGRALRPGGRLVFCCWREEAVNDFFAVPRAAVGPLVPPPAPAEPFAPGPLSLASSERIQSLLAVAGFTSVTVTPVTVPLLVGSGPRDAAEYLAGMGPARALLADAAPDVRAAGIDALAGAFASRVADGGVRLGAAVWLVTARRPGE